MSAFAFIVLILAVHRVTRLAIMDTLTKPLRDRTVEQLNHDGYLYDLLTCPWCLGFWTSLAAYGLWRLDPHTTVVIAIPFAIASVVGLIFKNIDF